MLDAAERLLSEQPPDSIRVEDIAEAARISPATIYVPFGTLNGLVTAVVERLLYAATVAIAKPYEGEDGPRDRVWAAERIYR